MSFNIVRDLRSDTSTTSQYTIIPVNTDIQNEIVHVPSLRFRGMIFYGLKDNGIYYSDGTNFYLLATLAQLNALATQINNELTIINGDLTTINGEITNINNQITNINGEISTINGDITTINGEIVNINTTIVNNYAILSSLISANSIRINELSNSINLPISFIWKTLPIIQTSETQWTSPIYKFQILQLIGPPVYTSNFSTSATEIFVQQPPPNGIVTVDPYGSNVYPPDCSSNVTLFTETIPLYGLLNIQVGILSNTSTLYNDFINYIVSPIDINSLCNGLATFNSLHPIVGNLTQLPYQVGTLLNPDIPSPTYTTNSYPTIPASVNLAETVISGILSLVGAVASISTFGVAGSIIGGVASVINAGISYLKPGIQPSSTVISNLLPYTQGSTLPVTQWNQSNTLLTYTACEKLDYIDGGSFPGIVPPPVPRTIVNYTNGNAIITNPVGPFVPGIVILGDGYTIQLSNTCTSTPGLLTFPSSHMYATMSTTTNQGLPGLLTGANIKGGINPTTNYNQGGYYNITGMWSSIHTYSINDAVSYNGQSYASIQQNNINNIPGISGTWELISSSYAQKIPSSYKYAQYVINFNINRPYTYTQTGELIGNWNVIYINGLIYGVFDGTSWITSDNLVNP